MAFAHQVGGHAATILASPLSSSTLIKPAHDRELDFYQRVGPQLADGLLVREWTPGFYGTLRAHRPPPAAGQGDDTATAAQEDNAAVLSRQPDVRSYRAPSRHARVSIRVKSSQGTDADSEGFLYARF